jgi:hypothetical protein
LARGIIVFLHEIFYRGRKDALSEKFMNAAIGTLNQYWGIGGRNYREELPELLKNNGVNNKHDRRLIIEVINFIFDKLKPFENNIVKYTLVKIKEGSIREMFYNLNKIYAIGDKIACLYLRDIILIYDLEHYLKVEDFEYCQPIDTWVKQVAMQLKIIDQQVSDIKTIKNKIITTCFEKNISPLLVNAGSWFVGAKSFELLLEKL